MPRVEIDASAALKAGTKLSGAKGRIQHAAARVMNDYGEQAVEWVKREYRSGPTTRTTTQVRSNRLRASYTQRTQKNGVGIGVVTDVGLIQPGDDVLRYGRLMEGWTLGGGRFTQKTIRAKASGWLTFPIYSPDVPGMAQTNIVGWVRKKSVIFRPRPALDAAGKKYAPLMQRDIQTIIIREAGDVA